MNNIDNIGFIQLIKMHNWQIYVALLPTLPTPSLPPTLTPTPPLSHKENEEEETIEH